MVRIQLLDEARAALASRRRTCASMCPSTVTCTNLTGRASTAKSPSSPQRVPGGDIDAVNHQVHLVHANEWVRSLGNPMLSAAPLLQFCKRSLKDEVSRSTIADR